MPPRARRIFVLLVIAWHTFLACSLKVSCRSHWTPKKVGAALKERGKPLIVICGCHDASAVHRLKKETSHLFVLSVRRASSPLHYLVNFFLELLCHIYFTPSAACNRQVIGIDTHEGCVFKFHEEIINLYDEEQGGQN